MLSEILNTQIDKYTQPFMKLECNTRFERDIRYFTYLNTEIKEKYNISTYLNIIIESEIASTINMIQKEFKYKIYSWEIFKNNETKKVNIIFNTDLSHDITSEKIYEINKQIYNLFSLSKYTMIDSILVI